MMDAEIKTVTVLHIATPEYRAKIKGYNDFSDESLLPYLFWLIFSCVGFGVCFGLVFLGW